MRLEDTDESVDGNNDGQDHGESGIRQFDYREIFSLTTRDRRYVPIYLAGFPGYNANIIPHPTKSEFWIVVVQRLTEWQLEPSTELVCEAGFLNGALVCTAEPTTVDLKYSTNGACEEELTFLKLVAGPRDARLFMGPDRPYITYGSQSDYICFGQWIQDARVVLDDFQVQTYIQPPDLFSMSMELKRPGNFSSPVEKNYFLFWDSFGVMHAHYNLWPQRSFARLELDGSGVTDLASVTNYQDQMCMAKYLPPVYPELESIHQATNSLSITLCERSDPTCVADDTNTFIMHIFHHKSYHSFHGMYEPYVVLMQRTAPFALHAISQRPFWIHGREQLTELSDSTQYRNDKGAIPDGHSEMFYVTSMNWKSHLQKYHGYIDDVLFIGFGIEDAKPGMIDVLAGDLLQDLAFCS
jgi:hypothetical protein